MVYDLLCPGSGRRLVARSWPITSVHLKTLRKLLRFVRNPLHTWDWGVFNHTFSPGATGKRDSEGAGRPAGTGGVFNNTFPPWGDRKT